MYKVMIVEDDYIIASKLKEFLMSWNYDVCLIQDFSNVYNEFIQENPHIVLMDISLPFFNGYYWTKKIRETSNCPILFISSASDNMNMVMALDQGGDDYVIKPFDLQILAYRIKALLRRCYDFSEAMTLEHKGVLFSVDSLEVSYQGQTIELTKNEARILTCLLEHKNKVVKREELMEYLWKTDFYVDENTLNVNVNRLRKKLEKIGIVDFISTKKGLGYSI